VKSTADFSAIVTAVEQCMATFYGFTPQASAVDHLLNEELLAESLGAQALPIGRAAVLLNSSNDELFIGVHFSAPVVQSLIERDPTRLLDDHNLDGFCLIVEEISHFHLLLNRAAAGRKVSKLELEGQGEVDKLLLAALFLERQCGDLHLLPLARRLYDGARIVADDQELYWQATRYAARFWFNLLQSGAGPRRLDARLRTLLQLQYNRVWSDKLDALVSVGQHAA